MGSIGRLAGKTLIWKKKHDHWFLGEEEKS